MKESKLEADLYRQIKFLKPEREYKFHPDRRWRFDFAFPSLMIAIEVEGGVWKMGRHTRGMGFKKDSEKYNAASLLGWRLLRFESSGVRNGDARRLIEEMVRKYAGTAKSPSRTAKPTLSTTYNAKTKHEKSGRERDSQDR